MLTIRPELLLEKTQACDNNPEESSTSKTSDYIGCCYSLFTPLSFDSSRSSHDFYRGAECMERFSANVRMYPTEKNSGEKKDILPLRDEEIKS